MKSNSEYSFQKSSAQELQKYLSDIGLDSNPQQKTIFIQVAGNIFPVQIRDIIFCHSNDPFVTFIFYSSNSELITLAEKKSFPSSLELYKCNAAPAEHACLSWRKRLTMNDVDTMFNSLHFCQVHKSYLINLLQLKKVILRKSEGSKVVMSNGDILPVSAKGKGLFMERVGKL